MNTYTNIDTSRTSCSVIKHCCKFKGFMCEYANENGYCRVTACAYSDVVYHGSTIVNTRILKENEAEEMTDTKKERIAKQLLEIVSDIWCSRESDIEPYFNCLICEFKDGPECRLHKFINSTKYETTYPQGMIGGDTE